MVVMPVVMIAVMVVVMVVVMPAPARLAVHVLVGMVVIVGMGVPVPVVVPVMMIVPVVVIVVMIMTVIVPLHGAVTVGSALRIEGIGDVTDVGAELHQHVLDHMILADSQPVPADFGRQMAVAEMPGDPHQMERIPRGDLQQPLGLSLDDHEPPVLQLQGVPLLHHLRFRQVEEEDGLPHAAHHEAPPMPVVALEHQRVRGFAGPGAGREDACGGDHEGEPVGEEISTGLSAEETIVQDLVESEGADVGKVGSGKTGFPGSSLHGGTVALIKAGRRYRSQGRVIGQEDLDRPTLRGDRTLSSALPLFRLESHLEEMKKQNSQTRHDLFAIRAPQ